ncbi:MAG: hypothetical protein J5825_02685 [Lachnospiraceae bacterium]|nr:hypothetical protein [Lachnospiraceae bacterium]
MKKRYGIILAYALAGMMIISLTGCSGQNAGEGDPKATEAPDQTKNEGTDGESAESREETEKPSEKETEQESSAEEVTETDLKPFGIVFPDQATRKELKDGEYVETDDYLIYAFGTDTVSKGAVYDEIEVLSWINSEGMEDLAKEALCLKDYTISEDTQPIIYSDVNKMGAVKIPFSAMEMDTEGVKAGGEGFAVIYGKREDVGIYVVLGILKDPESDQAEALSELMEHSAFSLTEGEQAEPKYTVFRETMPDDTEFRGAYPADSIKQVEVRDDGIRLYYDEEHTGYILMKHEWNRPDVTSEEYFKVLTDNLKTNEEAAFSEEETFEGKMTYHKVSMSYPLGEETRSEIVCLTSDAEGSVWIIDLNGTEDQVKDHEEDLRVLLWSLEEE